ncbi:unknown protein [Desulfotalea psychrophila LSv54]|uniref:Uncharacterized protein n=1 Tax=Desulfotalea psychrophila (strain LSv54 / DSM 12343) TaxID=177439 RepID=Q6AN95_DESPS|nr:unknown protein [Desulfotalea psychrophila LSv54]
MADSDSSPFRCAPLLQLTACSHLGEGRCAVLCLIFSTVDRGELRSVPQCKASLLGFSFKLFCALQAVVNAFSSRRHRPAHFG